jgi:hypothetical protein
MNNPAPKCGPSKWVPKHKIKIFWHPILTVYITFLSLMRAIIQNKTVQLAPEEKLRYAF